MAETNRNPLHAALTAIAAAVIGTLAGLLFAAILGGITGLVYDMLWGLDALTAFFVGYLVCLFGALAGLIAGVGAALLGIRTRSCLEWAAITGIGIAMSTVSLLRALTPPVQFLDLFLWSVAPACISAIAAWLTVRVIIRFLGQRIPRRPMKPTVLVGYLVALILVGAVGYTVVAGVIDMAYHM